jgi:hypothetical protein
MLAGMGGALFSAAEQRATPFTYFKFQSLLFLTLAVIGGIGNWIGALAGAVIFLLVPPFVHEPFVRDNALTRLIFRDQLEGLLPVFFGLGAIGLARNPHGFAEQIRVLLTPRRVVQRDEPPVEPAEREVVEGTLVALASGTLVHRADCSLVVGKELVPVGDGLRPCPICEPAAPQRSGGVS